MFHIMKQSQFLNLYRYEHVSTTIPCTHSDDISCMHEETCMFPKNGEQISFVFAGTNSKICLAPLDFPPGYRRSDFELFNLIMIKFSLNYILILTTYY